MARTNEDVDIKLGLDAKSFQRTLTSVKASFKSWKNEVASDLKSAFAFGAVIAGMKELGSRMAALQRQSEDIGASTDFLQSLSRMSVKFGGAAEDADNALAKLAETIGQARTEGGAAEEKFTKLGISLYNANGEAKTTEEVFKDIANRYRAAADATTKAAIAFEFFGKTGRNINNILGEGADGIDEYTERMKKIGLVASAANVARVAEAWRDLNLNITGAGTSLAGWALRLMDVGQRIHYFLLGIAGDVSFSNLASQIKDAINGTGAVQAQRARESDETYQRRMIESRLRDEEIGRRIVSLEEKLRRERFDGLSDQWKIVELEIELKELLDEEVDVLATENAMQEKLLMIAEKRMQIDKIRGNLAEKQAKDREDEARKEAERNLRRHDELTQLVARRQDVVTAREDRTKFTLEELATANVRGIGDPTLRADAMKAKQVRQLEFEARRTMERGGVGYEAKARGLLNRAEELRQSIGSLRSEERLTSMSRSLIDINKEIEQFNNLAGEKGVRVRPVFG